MIFKVSTTVPKVTGFIVWGLLLTLSVSAQKVSPSVIVASIEGEVSSLNMVDDFKVQMGPTSVGKKVIPKTILSTGKNGKVALLFSNGTLITIKPGSRFYLRTYKQLEGVVEGVLDPGKLEEEPTQSELSGHLDYGDLVVKAPKLKKGSSMKLTSPLGVAGIRGTMFQLMAVRNSVTGDIMGGVNLISGDIDFTDTGGNMVTLLSGQSIQLATSKLGTPMASMTGELVDLSSTYGPALTDGFSPPPPESIFPSLSASSGSGEDAESDDDFDQGNVASSGGNFDFIHQMASEIFFEIEEAEGSSSEFSFESMAMAPTVDIPTPEVQAPTVPASVTGETAAGGDIEYYQGGYPELRLLGENDTSDPLVKIFNNGARMEVEMRAPSEGIIWRKIDPWVTATDFLGQNITNRVSLGGAPKINVQNAEIGSFEVSYTVQDLRGLRAVIFRKVDVIATPPSIQIANDSPSFPWNEVDLDNDGLPFDSFYQWMADSIIVTDVRGQKISSYTDSGNPGTFSITGSYNLASIGTFNDLRVKAVDWRGITNESEVFSITISPPQDLPGLSTQPFFSSFVPLGAEEGVLEYGDPQEEFTDWLTSATAVDAQGNDLNVTYRVEGSDLKPQDLPDIWPGEGAEYTIVFEVQDPRVVAAQADNSLINQLKTSETRKVKVVATPPKLELLIHNPRPGLSASNSEISYLVRSKYNEDSFPDDGPFEISPDPGEDYREDRKVYYKATAYDGFGESITDMVTVANVDLVKDDEINEDTTLLITVNDSKFRGLQTGAESSITPQVKIVDVLPPILRIPSDQTDPFIVQGIMPEITLVNGSKKIQVSGNSVEDYYFNDPGIVMVDNYFTTQELLSHNEIDSSKTYTFKYTNLSNSSDTSGYIEFNPVFEYPATRIQTDLNMGRSGTYSLTYSISDPSGNSATLTRTVQVEDELPPVVKLYGSHTLYFDLQSIWDEETRYYDPGAFAIEDLYQAGAGFFDWDTEDDELSWEFEVQLCNDLLNDTYENAESASRDYFVNKIAELENDPPSQVLRYKFHYIMKDRAGNEGRASRIIELRGSTNLYPSIFFVLNVPDENGTPTDQLINSADKTATLPLLIWEIEVGETQYSTAPQASVFTDLGSGREDLDNNYSVQHLSLDSSNSVEILSANALTQDFTSYFSNVNYWEDNGVLNFVSGSPGSYTKVPTTDTTNWRREVFRYSVTNSLGNKSVRDLEVRLFDTTPPTITKNIFTGGTLEVGSVFNDPGVVITDSAGSTITSTTTIDLVHPQGADDNATFIELSNRGFWEAGDFSITYTAEDEFGNQAESQILNLTVQDSKDPHVAVITHDALNKFNAPSAGLDNSDLEYEYSNDPVVSPHSIFENSSTLSTKLKSLSSPELYDESTVTFSSEIPYLVEDGTKDFLLKASELDSDFINLLRSDPDSLVNGVNDSNSYIEIDDVFGRTFVWYSPLTILFNDGKTLQDPGVLIYEPSSSGVDVSVTIVPVFKEGTNNLQDNSQIESISLSLTVQQTNNGARQTIISNIRTYRFLDDIKPLITISPDTDDSTTFIVVEAGSNYDDNSSNGQAYRMSIDGNVDDIADTLLSIQADDVSDGPITSSIVRTITDLNDSSISSIYTSYNFVNHIYKIEYNVQDSEGNAADTVYRYLIIKDTTPPVLNDTASSSEFVINFTDSNNTDAVINELLKDLTAVDYGPLGASGPTIDDTFEWEVNISKPNNDPYHPNGPFVPGEFYPYDVNDGFDLKYTVTITAKDTSGNISLPKTRYLKIRDNKAPVIEMIGSSPLHDFFRFGEVNATASELMNGDTSNQNSPTGFSGGEHRVMLDKYSFVDPGAYAHDYNSYFSIEDGYPDLDGDTYGETYAIRRVTNRADMENCDEIGVIYAYSSLHSVSIEQWQGLMALDAFGFEVNASWPENVSGTGVRVPAVEDQNYTFQQDDKNTGIFMDVIKATIEYRVRDGWDNVSDIETREVYIYESKQYPDFAFYATPLTSTEGTLLPSYYDNGSGTYLDNTRKDSDGDGVSDFWEIAIGTDPRDSGDRPTDDQLSDPEFYQGFDFNPSSP